MEEEDENQITYEKFIDDYPDLPHSFFSHISEV